MNLLRKIGQEKPRKPPSSQYENLEDLQISQPTRPHTFRLDDFSTRGECLELNLFDPLAQQSIVCYTECDPPAPLKLGHIYRVRGFEEIILGD